MRGTGEPSASGRAPSSGSWMSVSPLTNSRLVSRPESRTLTWTATPSGTCWLVMSISTAED